MLRHSGLDQVCPVLDTGESSTSNYFWMPVEDPVFSGDQVRYDGFETFHEIVNIHLY